MADASAPKTRRVYCNACQSATNHIERYSHVRSDVDDDVGYWSTDTWMLLTCAGCDTGVMLRIAEDVTIAGEPEYTFFPARNHADHPKKVFRKLPAPLQAIYGETVEAYNHGLRILCAGGLRALIEGICGDRGIKGHNLEAKIDGLAPLLPSNIVESLHSFRLMGNQALHDLGLPARDHLRLTIEVSEDLLNFLYELDYKASRLPLRRAPKQGASAGTDS